MRASLAVAALELAPPSVRSALISDPGFTKQYGLKAEAVLSLGQNGVSFQRSTLFEAVRSSFDASGDIAIEDKEGQTWRVEFRRDRDSPSIALIQDDRRLVGNHFVLLSPDPNTRLQVLRAEAHRVNLPLDSFEHWETLLQSRPPEDDELAIITTDITDTPVAKRAAIEEGLAGGPVSLEFLIPHSERYYERLVGRHRNEETLDAYIVGVAKPHMEGLLKWQPVEGYLLACLLASYPTLGAALGALELEAANLIEAHDWLALRGDALSRAAAIESGFSRLQAQSELKESLLRLIQAMTSPSGEESYALLSALFMLVYGEIAYSRVLASKPIYWRRLAALAHAALIARVVTNPSRSNSEFVEWARNARAQPFLLQSFADMRLAPRWLPELALPNQMKNELGGRVFMAATANADAVANAGWTNLLTDDVEGSLRRQLQIAMAALPGPLEGSGAPMLDIPEEHLAEMRADLSQPLVNAASFSALANGSLLFRVPDDICDLAADAIVRADYQLERAEPGMPIMPYLIGLATAASTKRNHKLADALFILLRKYRRVYPGELSVEDTFRVGMILSASRADLSEWCRCVGEFITDLAFQDMTENEAVRLHSHLVHLCELVPELWAASGHAEAALRSLLNE